MFVSSIRRHTRCALVTGVQTCALPIWRERTIVTCPPLVPPASGRGTSDRDRLGQIEPPVVERPPGNHPFDAVGAMAAQRVDILNPRAAARSDQIGSASCRDRVCQYVSISVVAVSFKKKLQ